MPCATRVAFNGTGLPLSMHAGLKDIVGVLFDVVVAGGQFEAFIRIQVKAKFGQKVDLAGVGNTDRSDPAECGRASKNEARCS